MDETKTIADAIVIHAKAIKLLAQAIHEHTAAILQAEDVGDEEIPPRTYMDGTPVQ